MATPRLTESGSRRLSDLLSRGVAELGSRRLSDLSSFSFKHSKDDSPTPRVGESSTPRLAELESQQLPNLPNRRVTNSPTRRVGESFFDYEYLREFEAESGLKGSVRDLWGPNFCKNPRKSASLSCPFKKEKNQTVKIITFQSKIWFFHKNDIKTFIFKQNIHFCAFQQII